MAQCVTKCSHCDLIARVRPLLEAAHLEEKL